MEKIDLEKMSKEQLINLLSSLINQQKPIAAPRKRSNPWIAKSSRSFGSVKPPVPAPTPAPRTKKPVPGQSGPVAAQRGPVPAPRTQIQQTDTALKGHTLSFKIGLKNNKDPSIQLNDTRLAIETKLNSQLDEMKGLKYVESIKVSFEKQFGISPVSKQAYFNSTAQQIINPIEISNALQLSKQQILNKIAQWISEGSGWTISSVDGHFLNITDYKPLTGSSYIQLPEQLKNRKGLINLQNKDNECFRWCHIRHLNPQEKDPQRIKQSDRLYISKLDYSEILFPVTIKQVNKIEQKNNIRINVFGYENNQLFSKENFEDHMELLLITGETVRSQGSFSYPDPKIGEFLSHYVLIKDFNKFMFSQTKHKERKHLCMHCLQCFSSERVLNDHKENCITLNGTQAINMPNKNNNILKFNNFHKQQAVPFVIYADFEAITEKIQGCQPNDKKSFTEAYQKHTDCGYGYKLVCCYDDKYTKPLQLYRGQHAVYGFMEAMLQEVEYCKKVMRDFFNKPLQITEDDENDFKKANECHICNKKYTEKDIRVRDHCHITGEYRGSAHQDCNLKLKINPEEIKIPVIFHNLRGYDSHFIMQEIGEIVNKNTYKNKKGKEQQMNINAIPNNMEKYMAFMLGNHLTFLDSFQFMSSSLENLVNNLPDDSFKYTSMAFENEKLDLPSGEYRSEIFSELELMKKKGVYPYDHMDSFDKFNLTELPTKQQFYSILNDQHITDKDYQHAQAVWKTFDLKTMGDYHDLYLKSDVLLLADVFENFRKTCLKFYELDPCHYFTSPGLSWDAMLKMTDINLELMTDIDMYQFIEKGMRGGISYIANRYGKANNKYMKDYDEKSPSKYLMYLDANNLYGWAMSQYLPTGGFRWLNEKQINNIDLAKYHDNSKEGLILEVDLEYPQELHDLHNDYPLGPEKIKVTTDMLADYSKKIARKYNISTGLVHKLIPTLNNKIKYVLHYRNLKLYTDLGLKITKVHRVLKFKQSPWLKQYIDFNTEKRKNAKNSFEKDFFKLMNNSVFGKTMENIRKRVDVRLVTDSKKLIKLVSKPTFVSSKIFNENLVAVHKIKESITLNRPAYLGMCILDLSKVLMYDFHYNYIKNKYGKNSRLLFTDTDSLTYEIETEDVYQDFWNDKDKFDNSDYPESSPFFNKVNKKVIGKFKDETASIPITEFIGLRSKMYSYIKDNNKVEKTAKGIKKNIIKNNIKHEDYKKTLFNNEQIHHKMKTIRSQQHQLGSFEINKISLSCFDDKRHLLEDGINSYAYGHYSIKN